MDEAVVVKIFNQTYTLRARHGAERLKVIAQFVDERMRQIAEQLTTYDVSKIAVLASLNIADEMQSLKERYEAELAQLAAHHAAAVFGEAQPAEEEGPEQRPAAEPQSWFDSIFDADEGARPQRERRLSSQVAAKLQSIRHTEQPAAKETDAD